MERILRNGTLNEAGRPAVAPDDERRFGCNLNYRPNIGIMSENRTEWVLADLACLKYGLVSVPLQTAGSFSIGRVMELSSPSVIICERAWTSRVLEEVLAGAELQCHGGGAAVASGSSAVKGSANNSAHLGSKSDSDAPLVGASNSLRQSLRMIVQVERLELEQQRLAKNASRSSILQC